MAELAPPLALLAQLEATGEISATMRRAGVNFYHLAQCRDRWRRFDPYRELFDALGGWDSPAALAAVAILDLGWPIDEFDPYRELFDALGGWDSPAALAAVAILDLGWPIEEFARS